MKISYCSISIDDYDRALAFYNEKLGFQIKHNVEFAPGVRWITLVSPEQPDGTQLLLEPNAGYPAMKALKESLVKDGIPFNAFEVKDIHAEYERLKGLGVEFITEPTDDGMSISAMMDDTCGNYIQIFQTKPNPAFPTAS
jgi:catechol 2,3-dioxygenase-like lactoylglutathione lyase family enzyme